MNFRIPIEFYLWQNVRSSQCFSESALFPGHVWSCSNFPYVYCCFWISQSLLSDSQNRKKRKMKGGRKDTSPLNPVSHFNQSGRGFQQWRKVQQRLPNSARISVIRSNNQWSEHRYPTFVRWGVFCPSWLPQATCKLLLEPMCGCLELDWELSMGYCYCTKS